jgi:ubiquinone/menaquinone biosynthesis C-methylase UbiE
VESARAQRQRTIVTDARGAYDEWHRSLDHEGADATLAPWHAAAVPHIGNPAGLDILEIGCGRGGFARWIIGRAARRLVFADFSPAAVDVARRDLAARDPSAEFMVADIERLPFPDASFDLVCSFETLEHVPHPHAGLAELVRVTKPGGRLVITTPNYFGLLGLYRIYRWMVGRPYTEMGQPINQPLTLFWRVASLKRLGCRVDVADGFGHYLYVPRRTPIRMHWLDGARWITRWFGAHSLTVATRRRDS